VLDDLLDDLAQTGGGVPTLNLSQRPSEESIIQHPMTWLCIQRPCTNTRIWAFLFWPQVLDDLLEDLAQTGGGVPTLNLSQRPSEESIIAPSAKEEELRQGGDYGGEAFSSLRTLYSYSISRDALFEGEIYMQHLVTSVS
jgi:hypothetical protein